MSKHRTWGQTFFFTWLAEESESVLAPKKTKSECESAGVSEFELWGHGLGASPLPNSPEHRSVAHPDLPMGPFISRPTPHHTTLHHTTPTQATSCLGIPRNGFLSPHVPSHREYKCFEAHGWSTYPHSLTAILALSGHLIHSSWVGAHTVVGLLNATFALIYKNLINTDPLSEDMANY